MLTDNQVSKINNACLRPVLNFSPQWTLGRLLDVHGVEAVGKCDATLLYTQSTLTDIRVRELPPWIRPGMHRGPVISTGYQYFLPNSGQLVVSLDTPGEILTLLKSMGTLPLTSVWPGFHPSYPEQRDDMVSDIFFSVLKQWAATLRIHYPQIRSESFLYEWK